MGNIYQRYNLRVLQISGQSKAERCETEFQLSTPMNRDEFRHLQLAGT